MKAVLSILFLLLGYGSLWVGIDKPLFTIQTPNEGSFSVFEVKNKEGLLTGYTSQIKAPVCEEGVCYDVDVVFNWNLIGGFTHFDTVKSIPLTKLDHIPFSPSDYSKLQSILTNFDLKFTGMSADKLVSKTKKEGLDAYSGATVAAIKDEVIAGALFTCHTLWHIANGAVVDSIKNHTASKLDPQLVKTIAAINIVESQYFIIDFLREKQWEENLDVIISFASSSDGYLAKNTFEKMPKDLFQNTQIQHFIKEHYSELDYYTRIAILNKLDGSNELSVDLLKVFSLSLTDKITSESVKVVDLLLSQNDQELLESVHSRLGKGEIKLTPKQQKKLKEKLNAMP